MKTKLLVGLLFFSFATVAFPQSQGRGSTGGGAIAATEQTVGDANVASWTAATVRRTATMTANRTVTLPLAASLVAGSRIMYIDKATAASSAFTCTILAQGADTVAGDVSYAPYPGPGSMEFETDGVSKWTAVNDHSVATLWRDATDPTKVGQVSNSLMSTATTSTEKWPNVNGNWNPLYSDNSGNLADVTTNDVSITAHGFAPKAPNDAKKFFNGTAAYSVPPYSIVGGIYQGQSPADSTTYYYGWDESGTLGSHTTYTNAAMVVPYDGTITRVIFSLTNNVNGTSESVQHYLRKNNTTDTTLSTSETWDQGASTTKNFTYTGLSIAVSTGDTIAFKVITPAWVTNPTVLSGHITVWLGP